MRVLVIGCLLVLLVSAVWAEEAEGHGPYSGASVQRGHGRLGKLFQRKSEGGHRSKRACTWWFEWKVNGANVNNEYVTNLLNMFFKNVCAKFS